MKFVLTPICMVVGHKWGPWEYTIFSKDRYCRRCDAYDPQIRRAALSDFKRMVREARDGTAHQEGSDNGVA